MEDTGVTAAFVRKILSYDSEIGVFTWRPRKIQGFNSSGKAAGGFDDQGYMRVWLTFGNVRRLYKAHRLAWLYVYGEWPKGEIDHIDGNRSNNSIANLRVATSAQNNANRRKRGGCSSRCKGVSWRKDLKKWSARIKIAGRNTRLGIFDTEQEAIEAYLSRAREVHGDFAPSRCRSVIDGDGAGI